MNDILLSILTLTATAGIMIHSFRQIKSPSGLPRLLSSYPSAFVFLVVGVEDCSPEQTFAVINLPLGRIEVFHQSLLKPGVCNQTLFVDDFRLLFVCLVGIVRQVKANAFHAAPLCCALSIKQT